MHPKYKWKSISIFFIISQKSTLLKIYNPSTFARKGSGAKDGLRLAKSWLIGFAPLPFRAKVDKVEYKFLVQLRNGLE